MVSEKDLFIQRIKYVNKPGIVALYDEQRHLAEEELPQPVSQICERLREARSIEVELAQGASLDEVAQARGVTTSHLKRVTKLLKLPAERLEQIERDDPLIQSLNFRTALVEAQRHQQWLKLVTALDRADRWVEELASGSSQAEIASSEGITRARVCQLIRLSELDRGVKQMIREKDERYYGVSLREIWVHI